MIIATVGRASALVVPLRVDKSTKVTAAPRSRTAKAAQAVAKEAVVDVVQFLRVRLARSSSLCCWQTLPALGRGHRHRLDAALCATKLKYEVRTAAASIQVPTNQAQSATQIEEYRWQWRWTDTTNSDPTPGSTRIHEQTRIDALYQQKPHTATRVGRKTQIHKYDLKGYS